MPTLQSYDNPTPVTFDKEKAISKLKETVHSLSFFIERIASEKAVMTDVYTHMGLMEHDFLELSELTDYQTVLKEEQERRLKDIRETMQENHRLKAEVGEKITAEQGSTWLRHMENILHAWQHAKGFQYIHIEKNLTWGVIFTINNDLHQEDAIDKPKTEIESICQTATPSVYEDDYPWEQEHMDYHNEILNTDTNKNTMRQFLQDTFPEAEVLEYKGRKNDRKNYIMTTKISVPYTDIQAYYEHCRKIAIEKAQKIIND